MSALPRITFAYDYGQVYLYDASREWPDDDSNVFIDALDDATRRGLSVGLADGLVDLLMVCQNNFEAGLDLEIHAAPPAADAEAWDHVVEFPLALPTGVLTLEASGGSGEETVELAPGSFCARWSGRLLEQASAWGYSDDDEGENPPDEYRLQLWPAGDEMAIRELKRSSLYDAL